MITYYKICSVIQSMGFVYQSNNSKNLNNGYEITEENEKLFKLHIIPSEIIESPKEAELRSFLSSVEFNLEDHGYYVLKNECSEAALLLQNEINYIDLLSIEGSNSEEKLKIKFGHNTQPHDNTDNVISNLTIRRDIEFYIEKLFGYYHDDYNYSANNKKLQLQIKSFLKKVVLYPTKITTNDFNLINKFFFKEEIIQIILLASVVNMRTRLTYLTYNLYEAIKERE
jgi:hypothetical protein